MGERRTLSLISERWLLIKPTSVEKGFRMTVSAVDITSKAAQFSGRCSQLLRTND
tara:strand:- start:238 stop:402 length:165 start_codon:yes stop_codon:yes gene_type:complete